jgi:hypothetical protein
LICNRDRQRSCGDELAKNRQHNEVKHGTHHISLFAHELRPKLYQKTPIKWINKMVPVAMFFSKNFCTGP